MTITPDGILRLTAGSESTVRVALYRQDGEPEDLASADSAELVIVPYLGTIEPGDTLVSLASTSFEAHEVVFAVGPAEAALLVPGTYWGLLSLVADGATYKLQDPVRVEVAPG